MNGIKQGKGIEYDINNHSKYIGEYLNGKKMGMEKNILNILIIKLKDIMKSII